MVAIDGLKKIKELLEIVNNKVGKLETHVGIHSATMHVIKDQQSVMNEKLDGLKKDVKEMSENVDAARGDIEGLWHQRDKREIDEIKTHVGLPLMPDTPTSTI